MGLIEIVCDCCGEGFLLLGATKSRVLLRLCVGFVLLC